LLASAIFGVESFLFTSPVCFHPIPIQNANLFLIILIYLATRVPDWLKDVDARVQYGINFGKTRGFIKTGDPIIVITGWKQGAGFTNTFRLMYVDLE